MDRYFYIFIIITYFLKNSYFHSTVDNDIDTFYNITEKNAYLG